MKEPYATLKKRAADAVAAGSQGGTAAAARAYAPLFLAALGVGRAGMPKELCITHKEPDQTCQKSSASHIQGPILQIKSPISPSKRELLRREPRAAPAVLGHLLPGLRR